MRVSIIQKPVFTSIKRAEKKPVCAPDSFVRSEFDFDKECKNYYSNLEKSMGIVTAKDIIKKANYVSEKTGLPLNDVYKTMGLLSQYSSYMSLGFVEDVLKNYNINSISPLPVKYIKNNIPLSNVMTYVGSKNFFQDGEDRALLIDSNLLETVKNMDSDKLSSFKQYLKDDNLRLLYFENFENGYNFLNQEKSFEDFTIDIIEKAKSRGKDFYKDLDYVLNGCVMENTDILSDCVPVNVISMKNFFTPEKIADNLNPILPSLDEFKSIVNNISRGKPEAQKEILDFLNKTMTVITPKQYGKYLRDIHKQLLEYIKEQGKTMDDVYFVVPDMNKSFVLANYVYGKVNRIENPNYLFLFYRADIKELQIRKELPENAVAVIVDDCVLSGSSMMHERFPYYSCAKTLSKDKNIVFAPIVSTSQGLKNINDTIEENNRNDKIIFAKILPNPDSRYRELMVQNSSGKFTTSLILPYMGPDMNCCDLTPLYEKFFYSPVAQSAVLIYTV